MIDRAVAPVHVPGWGHWLRVTDRHTEERISYIRREARAFDEGYYFAAKLAEAQGCPRLVERFERQTACGYADLRDFCLNYTDDVVLAARIALELVGPARGSIWEGRP